MAIAVGRARRRGEDSESVFVSMTDLTVSFLFVVLILLAFFATQFKPEDTVPRAEHDKVQTSLAHAIEHSRQLEDRLETVLVQRDMALVDHDAALARVRVLAAEVGDLKVAYAGALVRIDALDTEAVRLRAALGTSRAARDNALMERDSALARADALAAKSARL